MGAGASWPRALLSPPPCGLGLSRSQRPGRAGCCALCSWLEPGVNLPSVFISEKPVSPKAGTLKSPPKGFDTTAINKSYYNVVSG